ncbi:phenylalanine--tRNA ligase subunit alpha [Candidatus Saccharibacteria bacterium]|nr:phenylalanine--tRNA ligase subunit alpha [Candidatus Saccharibacteria bacterium]
MEYQESKTPSRGAHSASSTMSPQRNSSELDRLKAELKALGAAYAKIPTLPKEERASYGRELNAKKQKLTSQIQALEAAAEQEAASNLPPLDLTAPMAENAPIPSFLTADAGSMHPLMTELDRVVEIYQRMGFDVMESYQLDDEFHMFDSLNFAKDHPARDGYDTFRTAEGFIPPAHTSTMQHRALKANLTKLKQTGQIAVVIPGRVYRNEDVDATHEHTFYQCEGVYVSETCTLGDMLGILRQFFEQYYEQPLNIKTQPAYFPFTEPSLEFMIEKPASLGGAGKPGDYLEMLGCGMIHPRVLELAGIDSSRYQGFAWGGGIDRLVMLRYELDDVRHFESAKLTFLKEFSC